MQDILLQPYKDMARQKKWYFFKLKKWGQTLAGSFTLDLDLLFEDCVANDLKKTICADDHYVWLYTHA